MTFVLGDTDFGVDLSRLIVRVDRSRAVPQLLLEVHGHEQTSHAVLFGEDSAWSWALYAPYLYLRGFDMRSNEHGDGSLIYDYRADETAGDQQESALYMMHHRALSMLTVRISPSNEVRLEAFVDMGGMPTSIRVVVKAAIRA